MNKIDSIIIHCSATRAGQDLTEKDIDRMHRARGFSQIGYNYVIRIDGAVEKGRSLAVDGAHCNTKGFSESSYNKLCKEYEIIEVLGHRDTSPDLDGSGEVEPKEYIKACPCFDVRSEFPNFLRNTVVRP